jgi:hypothetical protein
MKSARSGSARQTTKTISAKRLDAQIAARILDDMSNAIKIRQTAENGSRFKVLDGGGCPCVGNAVDVEYLCETAHGRVTNVDRETGALYGAIAVLTVDYADGFSVDELRIY